MSARKAVNDQRPFARRVVTHDLPGPARNGVELAFRADRQAAGLAGVGQELTDFAVEVDAVDLVVGASAKNTSPRALQAGPCASCRSSATSCQGSPARMTSRTAVRSGRPGPAGPTFPEEAHRFLEIVVIPRDVPAVDDAERVVIARELQCLVHFLVEQVPVSGAVFHVPHAGGEKGANGLCLELANEGGKLVPAAKGDETAAVGVDAAESVGTLPRRVKRRDPAAAAAGDAAIIAAGDNNVRFLVDEVLPFVAKEYGLKLSASGNDRCIAGGSSGGIIRVQRRLGTSRRLQPRLRQQRQFRRLPRRPRVPHAHPQVRSQADSRLSHHRHTTWKTVPATGSCSTRKWTRP